MANPSLQIGNGKWAIKEDNLLGYSTAGSRFVPQPITMTRATLGTRVNPSGLVEDVELLGSELVTDGNFPLPNTNWILGGSGSNIPTIGTNDVAINSVDGNSYIQQSGILTSGKYYKITYDVISASATSNVLKLASSFGLGSIPTSVGTQIVYGTAISSTLYIERYTNGVNATITNVSVKEATIDNLPRVDYTDGTSSLLVEPQRRNLVTYSESISNLSSNTNGTGTFTITNNYTDSPEGVQNASRVQMSIVDTDDTNNYKLINTGSVMTTGVTREISFYAKSLTGSNQDVLVYWSYDQQIVTLTNDWQRFKISATSSNSGSVFIGTRGGSGSYFSGGDANLDFALWGYQIEDDGSGGGSSYATSYIPTSGSTVTRVKDQYEKTGISSLINSTEGVLFVEMAALADDGVAKYLTMNDGSSNNDVRIYFNTASNGISALLKSTTGATQAFLSYTVTDTTEFHKIAFVYAVNRFELWVDGEKRAEYLSGIAPVGLNTLEFSRPSNFLPLFAKVKQLQVFKTALKDEQLKTLTT